MIFPMRKWFFALLLFLVIAVGCIYIFIPSRVMILETVTLDVNQPAVVRCLTQPGMIGKWWGGKNGQENTGEGTLLSNGYTFQFKPGPFDVIAVSAYKGKRELPVSHISLIPLQKHSTRIQWKLEV